MPASKLTLVLSRLIYAPGLTVTAQIAKFAPAFTVITAAPAPTPFTVALFALEPTDTVATEELEDAHSGVSFTLAIVSVKTSTLPPAVRSTLVLSSVNTGSVTCSSVEQAANIAGISKTDIIAANILSIFFMIKFLLTLSLCSFSLVSIAAFTDNFVRPLNFEFTNDDI